MASVRRHESNRRAYTTLAGLVLGALLTSTATPLKADTPEQAAAGQPSQTEASERGSEARPLFVKTITGPKSKQEAAENAEDKDEKYSADRWMVRLTGALVFVGLIQCVVFFVQARRLKATIEKMDEVAKGQASDTARSIAEASRSASAMEIAASSMN